MIPTRLTPARVIASAAGLLLAAPVNAQWTVISLHPLNATSSHAERIDSSGQVGSARIDGIERAFLWHGTADSGTDLSDGATLGSRAIGIDDGRQVGFKRTTAQITGFMGNPQDIVVSRAVLWDDLSPSSVSLHPSGWIGSVATDADGAQQVGYVQTLGWWGFESVGAIWSGSAESFISLGSGPSGFGGSSVYAIHAGQQVGDSGGTSFSAGFATLWYGSADSAVGLHPSDKDNPDFILDYSTAFDVHDGQQVGVVGSINHGFSRAALWTGTAASLVYLHPNGDWTDSMAQSVHNGWQAGVLGPWFDSVPVVWNGSAHSIEVLPLPEPGDALSQIGGIWTDAERIYVVGSIVKAGSGQAEAVMWSRRFDACRADTDASGQLDFFDVVTWLRAYTNQAAHADWNVDGSIDFFDVQAFLASFLNDCP